ncbi:hypothetical protein [Desulfatitalea alkaliphila]|uniref:Uncharacterized protein n=1 Tax=Desulfatitalea alkaliphila TaxID=2929485 RepID=A0AA41R2R3_9BACT|nr:hypothetical protein [Desulfatitalea alkaliphila]MCJ8501054.1 hypothetical protein [Desulfatitalea alkaliphila]
MVSFAHRTVKGATLLLAVALLLSSGLAPLAGANTKGAQLEQIVADIDLLQQQLKDRIDQAGMLHAALAEQRTTLNAEIQVLLRSLKIKELRQTNDHPRLRHNLELLRTIHTYMDELEAKQVLYRTGRDRLSYLRQLARDDIRMIRTVSDLKIDALTTQISMVINRYLPEAHTIQIDPQKVSLLPIESVWQRVKENR